MGQGVGNPALWGDPPIRTLHEPNQFMKNASQSAGSSCPKIIVTMATALLFLVTAASGAPPWGTPQMQPGIAIVTCIGPKKDAFGNPLPANVAYSLGLMDIRNPNLLNYGMRGSSAPLWTAVTSNGTPNLECHHEPSWTAENLGMLFGTEIDSDGDMYVAAGGLYPNQAPSYEFHRQYGVLGGGATDLAAAGTIYKIDRNTGVASVFSVLPQQAVDLGDGFISGPGVGNIAYDSDFDQFFATSMEDGMIYRIPAGGGPPSGTPFDPLTPDSGDPGMPPVNDRLWGISVHNKQVYYAVWNTGYAGDEGKIRRVDLDATGAIIPSTDTEILTVPGETPGAPNWSAIHIPVADIEISADGQRMILAQRGQRDWQPPSGFIASANHAGRVFLAQWDTAVSSWGVTNTLQSGNSWGQGETYGGADFGMEGGVQEELIWCSSADTATDQGPHGLQGVRVTDFPLVSAIVDYSYRVPYDPDYTTSGPDYKGVGGDIDIMQDPQDVRCVEIEVRDIECPEEEGAPFSIDVTLTNLSGQAVKYLWFTPCPADELPGGAITGTLNPDDIIEIPGAGIPDGGTYTQNITLPTSNSGEKFCLRLTMLDSTGEECCTEKFCFDLPNCDCLEVIDQSVTCEPQPNGLIKYTIELAVLNLTNFNGSAGFDFAHATFLPPSGFVDASVEPSPNPIPPGGIGTVEACYIGLPGSLCISFAVHDSDLVECCSQEICIELPECGGEPELPDACKLDDLIPCRPNADGGGLVATTSYTICNNSSVPRTYTWSATSIPDPACPVTLPPSAFSPASGTIGPVPPGGCVTIPIQINCEGLEPGFCAAYQVCAVIAPDLDPICCRGKVFAPEEGAVVIGGDPSEPVAVPVGGSATTELLLENTSNELVIADFVISDTAGILGVRESLADTVAGNVYRISVSLDPGEVYPVDVLLTRFDDGTNSPDFTSLQIHRLYRGDRVISSERLFSVSVRLSRQGEVPFGIRRIALLTQPEPLLELTIATRLGRTYRVRESTDLITWVDAACSVLDGVINRDGTFTGTGGEVICGVPCEVTDPRRFFMVIENP